MVRHIATVMEQKTWGLQKIYNFIDLWLYLW
jgi:hypothetical protein